MAIGSSDTNTRNYLDRGSKPGADYLERILRRFETVNGTWLLTGKGEPFLVAPVPTTSNTAHVKNNSGIAINNGTATITLEACQRELENMRRDAASYQREIELLNGQLSAKDALIAAKDETITLLRASYNRSN